MIVVKASQSHEIDTSHIKDTVMLPADFQDADDNDTTIKGYINRNVQNSGSGLVTPYFVVPVLVMLV